jgi:hypothetical protein
MEQLPSFVSLSFLQVLGPSFSMGEATSLSRNQAPIPKVVPPLLDLPSPLHYRLLASCRHQNQLRHPLHHRHHHHRLLRLPLHPALLPSLHHYRIHSLVL